MRASRSDYLSCVASSRKLDLNSRSDAPRSRVSHACDFTHRLISARTSQARISRLRVSLTSASAKVRNRTLAIAFNDRSHLAAIGARSRSCEIILVHQPLPIRNTLCLYPMKNRDYHVERYITSTGDNVL